MLLQRSLKEEKGGRKERTREMAASRVGLMLALKTEEGGHEPRGVDSH